MKYKHHEPGALFNAHKEKMEKKHKKMHLNPPSKGHAPKGAHGRAAVHALGRTKTTGNFAKIAAAKGKGAAIMAYQHALAAHKGKKKHKKNDHDADDKGKHMKKKKHHKIKCKKMHKHTAACM